MTDDQYPDNFEGGGGLRAGAPASGMSAPQIAMLQRTVLSLQSRAARAMYDAS